VEPEIIQYARDKGVTIMTHNVIYKLVEDVTAKLSERLPPSITYSVHSEAEVLQVFEINIKRKVMKPIAGCQVKNGTLKKNARVRVLRKKEILYDGTFESMKSFSKEVTEIPKGTECGVGFEGWGDFQVGDVVQTYEVIKTARSL
jgi:translation initiation factor IF-2